MQHRDKLLNDRLAEGDGEHERSGGVFHAACDIIKERALQRIDALKNIVEQLKNPLSGL